MRGLLGAVLGGNYGDLYGTPQQAQQYQNVSAWARARGIRTPFEEWKDESGVEAFAKEQRDLAKKRTQIAGYVAGGLWAAVLIEMALAYFAP